MQHLALGLALAATPLLAAAIPAQDPPRPPNVLFLVLDDLNDWVGCLGGHPQARTPNIDRLAAQGVLFTNAYCAAASCNPSRTAVFTGRAPLSTGLLRNEQKMREVLPDEVLLPAHLSTHGYWSAGGGKLLHYIVDGPSWDAYFPSRERENPFPRTLYPEDRPLTLPREPWMYVETDWGPLDATLDEYGGDHLVARWAERELAREHERPFFLACGIYRPHEPWFVPREYFDRFPLDSVELPPGVLEGDLDDVPTAGQRLARNRYLPHIQEHDLWRSGVRAYLAAISFADDMVGRVLDALDASPHRDTTIVVLWSDHGWHLGEKEHWQKYTGWRVCARVPLMIRVPPGLAALPDGTPAGARCAAPVSLLDLFPTLTGLCGVPAKPGVDGHSLLPLLRDPDAAWPHLARTQLDRPGSFAISGRRFRYIHYQDGGEELYDLEADPYEWHNLAGDPAHADRLAALRAGR
jgi:arylsulfatase A-like enzyme